MLKGLTDYKNHITKKARRIAIGFTVTVHLIYILYLIFATLNNIGIKWVNITLAVGTVIFMIVYLIIKLTAEKPKKKIKTTKKFFKRFRLATRMFSTITAIYTIITAVGSISPIAIFFAGVSAVILTIRLIFEIIISMVERKTQSIKDSIQQRLQKTGSVKEDYVVSEFEEVDSCYISDNE